MYITNYYHNSNLINSRAYPASHGSSSAHGFDLVIDEIPLSLMVKL